MKSNSFLRNFFFGYSEKRIIGRKKIMTTYVSLFLVCVLLITSTFAWFTIQNSASLFTDLFRMDSSTGLSINDGESITNKIVLDDFKLTEASSVDGRNMFFPVSGLDGSYTNDLAFREGNAGDKNVHYASKNITLVGVTDPTNIYIKSYNITVKGTYNGTAYEEVFDGTTHIEDTNNDGIYDKQLRHEKCPIRVAFIEDSEDAPRVFDPTAIIQKHVDDYDAVSYIDASGTASVQRTNNRSFSDYIFSYDSEPLFQISHSDSIDLTMVAWLEGTGENWDRYADATISIEVVLESNYSEMVPVQFVDKTSEDSNDNKDSVKGWITEGDCIVTMAYKDRDGATKTVVMTQLAKTETNPYTTWVAMLPKDIVTNISFYRFSVANETIYNSWHTWDDQAKYDQQLTKKAKGWLTNVFGRSEGNYLETTRGTSLVYTARAGNGYGFVPDNDKDLDMKRLSPCIGFWDATVANKGLSGSGGGGGEEPTNPPQQGSSVNIGVNLDIPQSKNWITNNLKKGETIWVEFNTGDPVQMRVEGNCDHCTYSGQIEIGRTIKSIGLKNTAGQFYYHLPLKNPQIIVTSYNYNYRVDNTEDKIVQN